MNNKIIASPLQSSHALQLKNSLYQRSVVSFVTCVSESKLDSRLIVKCLEELLVSFEILRTSYHRDEFGVLWQIIAPDVEPHFIELDWQLLNAAEIEESKQQIMSRHDDAVISKPWHRVILAQMEGRSWLSLELLGLNTDTFSLNYLLGSLVDAGIGHLRTKQQVPQYELIQYRDISPWLSDFLLNEELADARSFWTREKSVASQEQQFALSRYTHSKISGYTTESIKLGDVFDEICTFAAGSNASVAELICASLRSSLARYAPKAELARMLSSRTSESLSDAIGPLSRAVPLFPEKADSFRRAIANEVECSELGADYVEYFCKENIHQAESFSFIFDAVESSGHMNFQIEQMVCLTEKCKLQFLLIGQGKGSVLQVTFDQNFIDRESLLNFMQVCKTDLLEVLDIKISPQTDFMSCGNVIKQSEYSTVLDWLVKSTHNSSAVVSEIDGQTVALTQIATDANRFANYLSELGVSKGDVVAVCLPRSISFITSMVAVVKIGAIYVPVDTELPSERISVMLQDVQAKAVINCGKFFIEGCESIDYNKLDLSEYPDTVPTIDLIPDDLAYILFTSGSTGKGKGVSISHRALLNHMNWICREFSFNPDDRILQRTSASFDASVWEFWAPLLVGATMIIAHRELSYDMARLKYELEAQKISRMQIVPSLLELLLGQEAGDVSSSLKTIFCGGEALKTSNARKASDLYGCEVVNLYGPSECCIDALFWRYHNDLNLDFVPIGYPIDNLICRVVKADGRAATVGEAGELYISGESLFSGYYHQPKLTEAVLSSVFDENRIYYKTGDYVRILADGNLLFIERLDEQVKLHGYRIEPEEVSMLLLNRHLTEQAVCIFCKSSKNIILFCIGPKITESEMSQVLDRALPVYMVPNQIIILESFPYLSNGKLDKRALLEHAKEHSSGVYTAPVTDVEKKIVAIWQELLEPNFSIGIHHDFFVIGGHSIAAMKVLGRIVDAFGLNVGVRVLFEYKTVAELASYIESLILLSDCKGEQSSKDMEGDFI